MCSKKIKMDLSASVIPAVEMLFTDLIKGLANI